MDTAFPRDCFSPVTSILVLPSQRPLFQPGFGGRVPSSESGERERTGELCPHGHICPSRGMPAGTWSQKHVDSDSDLSSTTH